MSDPLQGIGKLVPGFDFLQGLVKNAGSALPSFTQWVAPTLNPEELEKRISELRTVQFWLEQNSRMLGATIQALEVQRMTLSTLQTMNVPVDMLRDSLKVKPADPEAADAPAPTPAPKTAARSRKKPADASAAAAAVDPMQWWGALTKQFTTLATSTMTEALKDTATESARNLAGNLMRQSFNAAEETLRKGVAPVRQAAGMAGAAAQAAAKAASKAATPTSRKPAAKAPARKRATKP